MKPLFTILGLLGLFLGSQQALAQAVCEVVDTNRRCCMSPENAPKQCPRQQTKPSSNRTTSSNSSSSSTSNSRGAAAAGAVGGALSIILNGLDTEKSEAEDMAERRAEDAQREAAQLRTGRLKALNARTSADCQEAGVDVYKLGVECERRLKSRARETMINDFESIGKPKR